MGGALSTHLSIVAPDPQQSQFWGRSAKQVDTYLLSTYYVLGPAASKTDQALVCMEFTSGCSEPLHSFL